MSNTIFHKIINKEIPAEIVFEDEQVIAFNDISPAAPTHILVVPKKTLVNMSAMTEEDKLVIGHLFLVASKIAKQLGLEESGYRLVMNNGEGVGQTVFQMHLHILAGREFSWPPG